MRPTATLALCCGIFLTGANAAADEMQEGKALVKKFSCWECHGLSGNTGYDTAPYTPKIAGQPYNYLVKTLNEYRAGVRKDEEMNSILSSLSDQEIHLLSKYYAAQKRY